MYHVCSGKSTIYWKEKALFVDISSHHVHITTHKVHMSSHIIQITFTPEHIL
jgi:hypothetical protein